MIFELKQKVLSYEQIGSWGGDHQPSSRERSTLDKLKYCTVVESLGEKIADLIAANSKLKEENTLLVST
jgi:hypothetical protein